MLRAKPPEATSKRLKLFMFGPAGVGKTTAAIQFPRSYIIDAERGTENYEKLIKDSGSVVFQTTTMNEVIQEVRALLTEKHDFRTLVIDPITTVYNDLVDICEKKVGEAHGRHFGMANKEMRRLANLIMQLDMNVIITAHAKTEYGQNLSKLGYTFDGWRQLDYWFDLVVELSKKNKKRFAKVVKTRIEGFPDEDIFEWGYEAIRKRYDIAMLEKQADSIVFASSEQVREIKELLNIVRLPEGTVDNWFAKGGVDVWEDMPAPFIDKCIQYVRNRLPATSAANLPTRAEQPKPCPPVANLMSVEDANAFSMRIDEAFKSRGFSPEAADDLLGALLRKCQQPNIKGAGPEWCEKLISNIASGMYDNRKHKAAAPAA